MLPWRRLVPVLVLGGLLVAYVALRPALLGQVPELGIWEYPLGLGVAALLLYAALRRPRPERDPPLPVWRRHVQVVRAVPDPEVERLHAPLRAWQERGEAPEAAARVVAQASARDPEEAERLVPDLAARMAGAGSPKSRRKLLSTLTHSPPSAPAAPKNAPETRTGA